MSRPTVWWWIRHAPVHGAEGRINGQRDVIWDVSDAAALQALARVGGGILQSRGGAWRVEQVNAPCCPSR